MRISREEMLMRQASVVALRSTCERLHVGAIIARDGRTLSSGYNGNVSGVDHCEHHIEEVRSILGKVERVSGCTEAVHAEANAIAYAARYGVGVDGAELFTTHQPCINCAMLIVNAGISRVYFDQPYRLNEGLNLLLQAPSVDVFKRQVRVYDGAISYVQVGYSNA